MKGEKILWILIYKVYGIVMYGLNNQDFILKKENMLLVLDGCSESIYSEVGTRLFAQLFASLKDFDKADLFEKNVNFTFDKLIKQCKEWFQSKDEYENFINNNLLFTILACFKQSDKFIVKVFGDGYIVTQNYQDNVSYITLSYGVVTHRGKQPPYYSYKYCDVKLDCIDEYKFKTFIFDTKKFKRVGVATDGIKPIAIGAVKDFDKEIVNDNSEAGKYIIKKNKNSFTDDVTIGILSNGGI